MEQDRVKVTKVNRYYCEFCKKASLSAFHMRKHERGCTLNPGRECGMCKMVGGTQQPIAELIALLPDASPIHRPLGPYDEYPWHAEREIVEALNVTLPILRETTSNCPACILAALRQAKIPVPLADGFHFTNECKAIWDRINAEEYERSARYEYA